MWATFLAHTRGKKDEVPLTDAQLHVNKLKAVLSGVVWITCGEY
jgi:hypothetical protein